MTWLTSVLRLPIVLGFFTWFGFEWPGGSGAGMLAIGFLWTIMFVPYLKALEFEEPSRVALFLSMLSIFMFVLGYLILGETLTSFQGMAFVLILAGGALAALKRLTDTWHFSRAFWLIGFASLFWALSDVLFKKFATDFSGFMPAFSLFLLGSFLPALVLPLMRFVRHDVALFRASKVCARAWVMQSSSMIISVLGSLVFSKALVLGKVALTSVLAEIQPLFVFALTLLLARFFHDISPEDVTREALFFKGASLAMIVGGLIILYF